MTQEERIIKAKVNLLLNEPWFGQLACYLNFIESKTVPTAGINVKGDLFFNPDWLKDLSDKELIGLVCHEILHLVLLHPHRLQNRDMMIWNIAADLKVNEQIWNRSGMEIPKGCLIPGSYNSYTLNPGTPFEVKIENVEEKTTEQIYNELYRKIPKIQISLGSDGSVNIDDSKIPKGWKDMMKKMVKDLFTAKKRKKGLKPLSPSESGEHEQEWLGRVSTANQTVKDKGSIPAGVLRELGDLENPELPWHQIIRQRFLKQEKKRTWQRAHKKWLPFYFPGTKKNKTLKAVIAIDTSGSMTKEEISQAVSETWGLANTFKTFKLYIVWCDAKVWGKPIEVTNGNQGKFKGLIPKGGGGTDFRPVFRLIKKEFRDQIDCLVFFTDGWGDFPDKKSLYQTYWISQSTDITWPFGRFIRLKKT